jgi:hypothetical protein
LAEVDHIRGAVETKLAVRRSLQPAVRRLEAGPWILFTAKSNTSPVRMGGCRTDPKRRRAGRPQHHRCGLGEHRHWPGRHDGDHTPPIDELLGPPALGRRDTQHTPAPPADPHPDEGGTDGPDERQQGTEHDAEQRPVGQHHEA